MTRWQGVVRRCNDRRPEHIAAIDRKEAQDRRALWLKVAIFATWLAVLGLALLEGQ